MATKPKLSPSALGKAVGCSRQNASVYIIHHGLQYHTLPEAIAHYKANNNTRRGDGARVVDEEAPTASGGVAIPTDGLAPTVQKATIYLKARQAQRIERQIGLLDRKYVERDAVRRDLAAVVRHTRAVLMSEPRAMADTLDMAGLLADDARADVEIELYRRLEALCHQLAEDFHGACR